MTAKYEEIRSKLAEYGQEQLLKYYPELPEEEQRELLEQIAALDFSPLRAFEKRHEQADGGVISPIGAVTLADIETSRGTWYEKGLTEIRAGKLAAVLLAGGMGTRLGISGPKGTCDIGITKPVYIFQRLIENLLDRVRETGTVFELFIMTSEKNDQETRDFFRTHAFFGYPEESVHFFAQEMAPAVDEDGQVLLETPSRAAASPNGNGGWFRSMESAGLTALMREKGIEWLNVFAVDNVLQSICDPAFFGAVLDRGCVSGSKVVRKSSPEEKVGVMCLRDGRPSVVEYYELSDEMRYEKDERGEYAYQFGVILNYLFRVPELAKAAGASMPLHFAHKKIPFVNEAGECISPEEPNGWKFEYFIFDLLHELDSCLPYEVEREREFAPVKNPTGTDSVESARILCRKNGISL